MNNTDVEESNAGCKPNFDITVNFVPQVWLNDWNIVPGSTKMLIQEHIALCEIRFCHFTQLITLYI